MGVGMWMPVRAGIAEHNAAGLIDLRECDFESLTETLKRRVPAKGEIQVLGETVVRKVTLLKGRPAFEQQSLWKRAPGKTNQKP